MVLRIVLAATSHLYCFDRMVCAEEQTLLVNGQFLSHMKIKRPFFKLLQKLAIQNWTVFFLFICMSFRDIFLHNFCFKIMNWLSYQRTPETKQKFLGFENFRSFTTSSVHLLQS